MKFTKLLVVLLAVLTIFGCRKDIDGVTTQTTVSPSIPILQETSLQGLVVDQNDQPIAGARVEFTNITRTSDENGYFKFESIDINEKGFKTNFKKDGYFEAFKFVFPSESNETYIKVMLIEKPEAQTFNAASGGDIEIDGASISFKANSIVLEGTTQSYTGTVTAFFHWYDPGSFETALSMPGNLTGINLENEFVSLSTYGMVAVELYDDNGNELNLATNTTATLSMEAPDVNTLPGVMPTWSMNEETGFWEEEGEATLINGNYVAEVSHFSFWNCDDPYTLVFIDGLIQTGDNIPVSNAYVKIRIIGTSQCGGGYTNAEGEFSGYVPKDQALEITIYDECGDEVYIGPLGEFSEDTSLPPTFVSLQNESMKIKGTVICEGEAVTSGYVKISYGDERYTFIDLDSEGNFEVNRLLCAVDFTEISLFAINTDLATTSDEIVSDSIFGNLIDLGEIDACEIEFDEWFNYSIDGGEQGSLYEVDAIYGVPGLVIRAGIESAEIFDEVHIRIFDAILGINNPIIFGFDDLWDEYISCTAEECQNIEINLTNFDRFSGGYLEGTYAGTIDIDGDPILLEGDFRIRISEYVPIAKISGRMWLDVNANGLYDDGEPPVHNDNLFFKTQSSGGYQAITEESGDFFGYVPADEPFFMEYEFSVNETATLQDVGTDETIDSDFSADGITESFQFSEGEEYRDIGLGLIEIETLECMAIGQSTIFTCEGNGNNLEVAVTSGTPPYSYLWSNGQTTESIFASQDGFYSVTVTDANGSQCEQMFDLIYDLSSPVDFEVNNPTCGNSNGSIQANNENFFSEIFWQNSDLQGFNLENLEPGTYVYDAFDQNGCFISSSVTLQNINTVIGNQAWIDAPGGEINLFDSGDSPLQGVTVNLLDAVSLEVVESQVTDENGNYLMMGEFEGDYIMEFIPPAGYEFVENWNDIDDVQNSDVNPDTGRTGVFNVECGEFILYIDAGLKE